jgi:Capsule polysaccharide biosynthesis protein
MRFLFTTLQTYESDFYGRVGAELARRGHEVAHVTVSRRAARLLREQGFEAHCLPELIREAGSHPDLDEEVRRIEGAYEMPHIRDVYRADWACAGRPEEACVRRTVDHFRALELAYDRIGPDAVVPEVGNETIRIATHLIGMARAIPVLFLLYTIFPDPLRLYVDTLHAPIAAHDEVRELNAEEREEVESFRRAFTAAATPIREHRRVPIELRRAKVLAGHARRKATVDRDNEYLRPWRLLHTNASEWVRARAARPFYDHLDSGSRTDTARPFVYFPLHVTDDYKITRIIPHCRDQVSLVEQVADALPVGYDVVLKEHPMSIGRNSIRLLRRLRRRPNVRLVQPYTSSHDLIRESAAVAVISSTVGLEALLYEKPVLTLGDPFYAGFGVTLDVHSFAEIGERVPELLRFRPDPERIRQFLHAAMRNCYPGAPVLVDRSDENAIRLAGSIEAAARSALASRSPAPALA